LDPIGSFNRHIFKSWKGEYIRIGPYRVKGTPYLFEESFPGSLTYKGGRTVSDIKVLYDIYNQKAGVDVKSGMFKAAEPVENFSILLPEQFGGQKLLFKSSSLFAKTAMNCFFNILEDGRKSSLA
jgi:hypothetical protein